MIAHVVLFRPKADLSDAQRRVLVEALHNALDGIAAIKRARVGHRRTLGRLYDRHNAQEFPFLLLLEFETESALHTYLDHPVHRALGEQFYVAADGALAFDFEWLEGNRVQELLA